MDDRTLERFFGFADKNGPVAANNPELGRCWLWTGGKTRGYGIFWADGKSQRAHVWSYKTFVGEIPEDRPQLDHFACDRTECVNYRHVRPDTARGNILRSSGPAAENAAKDDCPAGHSYAEHGRVTYQGRRECTLCVRKRQREAAAAKRLEARGGVEIVRSTDTHCRNGHEWTPETTYVDSKGVRNCKTCRNESLIRSRARAKARKAAAA